MSGARSEIEAVQFMALHTHHNLALHVHRLALAIELPDYSDGGRGQGGAWGRGIGGLRAWALTPAFWACRWRRSLKPWLDWRPARA